MPVYNGEKFIREALDSLLTQTFFNFELIISDNASTDNTESICREYGLQDSRIRYLRQVENLGALRNFQFVLNEASCKYFMWAASDDKWDSTWIYSLFEMLKQTENAAIFGKLIQIDEFSVPITHPATNNLFNFSGITLKRKVAFFLEFEGLGKANLFYSLFKKQDLKGINLLNYEQDYYALFDMLNKIRFLSINDVFLYKRIHSAGEGVTKPKSLVIRVLQILSLKTIFDSFINAFGYLKYSHSLEKVMLIVLIPIKVFLEHLFLLRHAFKRFLNI